MKQGVKGCVKFSLWGWGTKLSWYRAHLATKKHWVTFPEAHKLDYGARLQSQLWRLGRAKECRKLTPGVLNL